MLSILYSQRIKKGVEESGVRIWFFSLRQNAVKKIIFYTSVSIFKLSFAYDLILGYWETKEEGTWKLGFEIWGKNV